MSSKKQAAAEPSNDERLLITGDEAAHRLSIGRSHLYDYLMRGTLRSVRIGRSRRIAAHDLNAFIDALLDGSTDISPANNSPIAHGAVKRTLDRGPRRR